MAGRRAPRRRGAAGGLLAALALCAALGRALGKTFADHYCEIHDCKGERASAERSLKQQAWERDIDVVAHRYHATGEVVAIRTPAAKAVTFRYESFPDDDPFFPGEGARRAAAAEIQNEKAAVLARRRARRKRRRFERNPLLPSGYLYPTAQGFAVVPERDDELAAADFARRRFRHLQREVRIPCQYDLARPGRLGNHTFLPKGSPWGCAAGSVWKYDDDGVLFNDGTNVLHRTNEHLASQWRLVNGSHKEWFEHPKHWTFAAGSCWAPLTREQTRAQDRLPYKILAPPPCAPGYGGAHCKREVGAGADYVDEAEDAPKAMPIDDVERIVSFWRQARETNARSAGAPPRPSAVPGARGGEGGVAVENVTAVPWITGKGGGVDVSVVGPWYGGWWIDVRGKGFGSSPRELANITVGSVRCKREVWLSPGSAACMVPKGMGHSLDVRVSLKGGGWGALQGVVAYSPPVINDFYPRSGAVFGGSIVTIVGSNFGQIDTKPTGVLAGRICLETFWEDDDTVLCRVPPGTKEVHELYTAELRFERAEEHVQAPPPAVREAVHTAKEDLLRYAESCQTDAGELGAGTMQAGAFEAGKEIWEGGRWLEWQQRAERLVREVWAEARRQAGASLSRFVDFSEGLDAAERRRQSAAAEEREAARLKREAMEAALRAEEEREDRALQDKEAHAQEERQRAMARADKTKDKFRLAKLRASQAKARKAAAAALEMGDAVGLAEALRAAREAELELQDPTVQALRAALGLPSDLTKEERDEEEKARGKASGSSGANGTCAGAAEEKEEDELPDLDLYSADSAEDEPTGGQEKGKKKVKKVIKKVVKKVKKK